MWFDRFPIIFQVMPQLLNYLDVDEKDGNSLDWGTLCVYTCRDSCSIGNNYAAEFLWKQDFAADRWCCLQNKKKVLIWYSCVPKVAFGD